MVPAERAAIYARISRDVEGQGLGVERQLTACRRLAGERGWRVSQEYVDNDISAYSGKQRPAYLQMLEDIRAGTVDGVIAYHQDRLTRQPIELEGFAQVCTTAGLDTVITVTSDFEIANDDHMFMLRMLGAIAAKESARKGRRIRDKHAQLAVSGMPNGGYHRPFGYEPDRMTVNEAEATVLRQVVDRYLAGEALMSLVGWLQDEGVTTTAGNPWRTSALRTLMLSARIAGLREHRGEVVGQAAWPAIITLEQRTRLLAAVERRRITNRRTPRRYLLSGMLRCGGCGQTLYSAAREQTRRYVCSSSPDHGRGCGKVTVTAERVEDLIARAVLMRLDSPDLAAAMAGQAAADDRQAGLVAEREAVQAQLDDLTDAFAQRLIKMPEWLRAKEPLDAQRGRLEQQLRHLSGNRVLADVAGRGASLSSAWAALPLSRQTAIIAAVLDHAVVQSATPHFRGFDPSRVVPVWRL